MSHAYIIGKAEGFLWKLGYVSPSFFRLCYVFFASCGQAIGTAISEEQALRAESGAQRPFHLGSHLQHGLCVPTGGCHQPLLLG